MATTSQIRKIHTLKSILGLEDDLYRDMLYSFGVCTSKDLTFTEAAVLLDILETKAVERNLWKKEQKKYEDMKNRSGKMATPPQLRMIKGLWRDICYFDNDEFATKSLRKFLKAKFKVDDIRFLTKAKANKVIQAIKGIKKNLKKSAAAL
ncbi:regulatory protein GemA [bacterium]|nr:regulatory protein GemA [bacterium]